MHSFILTSLFSFSLAASAAYTSDDGNVVITPDAKGCYDVVSKAKGWVGMGIGSDHMKGSQMFVGWKNTKGAITVANLVGPAGPTPPKPTTIVVKQGKVTPVDGYSGISFNFCPPASVKANGKFLWGMSDTAPTGKIDTPAATIKRHSAYGVFEL